MGLKFSVGLHGDKTYDTFRLWKHHVNALINLRGVSTNKKYSVGLIFKFSKKQPNSKFHCASNVSG
jgi:hypothetical protein